MSGPPLPPPGDLAALLPPEVDPAAVGGALPAAATDPAVAGTGGVAATGAPAAGLRHPDAAGVWIGMVWGRLGRGDLAWAHLDRVHAGELQPWIAAERGRLLRELGEHARAESWEAPALAAAVDPVDRAMLGISLAADAVGGGEVAVARARLDTARSVLAALGAEPRAERQRLRAAWVAVEIAMLTGEVPPSGLLPSWTSAAEGGAARRLHVPAPYRSGTGFHRAKGCLFAGVVTGDLDLLDLALESAPVALRWAVHAARASLGAPDGEVAARDARALVVPPPDG